MLFTFLYFSWIVLLSLNTEMRRFAYSGIRREECEGTSCSYPLGESIVAAYRLIPVGFHTLLEWMTWWLWPRWWAPSPVEGLGVSDIYSITCTDAGFSVMLTVTVWGSDPGCRYCEPGSSESSCQASLGRVIIEDLLRFHYFARVKFSCVASSECSYTRFFQFHGTVSFLMCYTVENVPSKTACYWG